MTPKRLSSIIHRYFIFGALFDLAPETRTEVYKVYRVYPSVNRWLWTGNSVVKLATSNGTSSFVCRVTCSPATWAKLLGIIFMAY